MTPHSSSIAFFSSTSSSTVILPSVSSTFAVSVAITPAPPASQWSLQWSLPFLPRPRQRARPLPPARPRAPRRPPAPRPRPRARRGLRLRPRLGGRLGGRSRLGLGRVALLLQLLDPGVDQPDEVAQRCRDECDDGGQRRDDRPDELCAQHVGRRQLGEALDLVGRQRPPSSTPPRIARIFVLAGGVAERLRDRDGIAVGLDERDRRRALEQREQRVRPGGLGRAAGERVLDDREAGAVLDQLRAQAVDLGVREAAVVGDDQRLRRPQPLGQLCDDSFLLTLLHLSPPLKRSSPHGGGLGE